MGTEKHEAKKQEILTSAFRIWGKCGYRNTSLSDLASAHDMTKQAIYRYFPSKAALEEAMEEKAMKIYAETASAMMDHLREIPAEDFVREFSDGTVEFIRKQGPYLAFLSFRYRQTDITPPYIRQFTAETSALAMERAGIPPVAMRFLAILSVMEAHGKDKRAWQPAWEHGVAAEGSSYTPQFDRLLSDAGRLEYSVFENDPLIRAVFEAVMEEGDNGVSLGKVARKAGLTKSSLYNYWPSKEEMLQDVLSRQVSAFSRLFDEYASAYSEPADRLFAYLAFTGTFFRRTPQVLNYMQRVMFYGIRPPRGNSMADSAFFSSLSSVMDAGFLNLGDYDPMKFLGLVNMAAVNEIKHHLTEGSARIHIDQCLKDLYLLVMGGISALRRTM